MESWPKTRIVPIICGMLEVINLIQCMRLILGDFELFEDLSLNKPELEAIMFDGANEDEIKDDVRDL
ncbi:hypothetical protein F2Q69_00015126 [Brassica cretica]|uniref:Uncharacterized protein n=1 Tax=Brassica cretica TaxID=69181 RepID=A0A8S9R286_BRACR|nr:hypothetical protein F2Q69_00015126 [Brassica cretica]